MDITVSCANEKMYPFLHAIGFRGVDIKMEKTALSADGGECLREKIRAAREAGLCIGQTHLPYCPSHLPPPGDGSYRDFAAEMVPLLTRGIELTAEAGCRIAVLHPYFETDRAASRAANQELISTLMPVLERTGVTLALENIYGKACSDVHLSDAADMLYYTEYFHSPLVGLCLDTGHALIRGQDPAKMLAALGTDVRALHVHTNTSVSDMHTIPGILNGGEMIRWDAFCCTLYRIGYTGTFNLEIGVRHYKSTAVQEAFYRLAAAAAREMLDAAETAAGHR